MSAPTDSEPGQLVFLIAGEPTGDQLGARLMAGLKEEGGGRVRFAGVGGEQMAEQGLRSLFPMAELAVTGLVEVVFHLPQIFRRISDTVQAVLQCRPDVVVTIDAPDFSLQVARRLKGAGIPLVHCVAPTVWAWKPQRAKKMAGFLDRVLALLPFEPPYFEVHGLACDFVGHPAVEGVAGGDGPAFRKRYAIPMTAPLLCALPGSRRGETRRLLPVFRDALALLAKRIPNIYVAIPTVSDVAALVEEAASHLPMPVILVRSREEKYDAYAAADVALAKSGTSIIELAAAGVPTVVTHRVNPLTAFMVRRMIRLEYVSFVNVLLGRPMQPELLQENCRPEKLAATVERMLTDAKWRAEQIEGERHVAEVLGMGGEPPSRRAARVVLDVIRAKLDGLGGSIVKREG
ncbi:MAG: lipid-A-disaccharide synthase [Gammaproteobacteria bacterium]|nr:lipid-A-disaccharide synthase [Gammaproteobacteria bacterium]